MDIPQAVIDYKAKENKIYSEALQRNTTAEPIKEQRQPLNDIATDVTVQGRQILVGGEPFTVKGVGYQPVPIGQGPADYYTSGNSAIWTRDLQLLRDMNCNTIRLWDLAPEWENHQAFLDACYNNGEKPIYVIAGTWFDPALLSDPAKRQEFIDRFKDMVTIHKDHPAILMWAFGNEANYSPNKIYFYPLLNQAAQEAHVIEGPFYHPVTTANGEVADIITYNSSVPDLDVWGVNVYRGELYKSAEKDFGNFFDQYEAASTKPMVLLEYGIDALNNEAVPPQEYEQVQADYDGGEWDEIIANRDVCSGGCIMAYSDEWWKAGNNLSHDNGGYANNGPDHWSNEEWYGIMRVLPGTPNIMQPREVYYTMQDKWQDAEPPNVSSLSVPWFKDGE